MRSIASPLIYYNNNNNNICLKSNIQTSSVDCYAVLCCLFYCKCLKWHHFILRLPVKIILSITHSLPPLALYPSPSLSLPLSPLSLFTSYSFNTLIQSSNPQTAITISHIKIRNYHKMITGCVALSIIHVFIT